MRVLAEIYQMLKKGEYHYARDAMKHEAKLAAYKKLLKSQTLSNTFAKKCLTFIIDEKDTKYRKFHDVFRVFCVFRG
ncbi:hypothetical protein AGMMS50268_08620 [Spirochaetia bacterium]|nr:hypothetical protein AGMMS50268_08620 [Spirochaetia bacterium]